MPSRRQRPTAGCAGLTEALEHRLENALLAEQRLDAAPIEIGADQIPVTNHVAQLPVAMRPIFDLAPVVERVRVLEEDHIGTMIGRFRATEQCVPVFGGVGLEKDRPASGIFIE